MAVEEDVSKCQQILQSVRDDPQLRPRPGPGIQT